MVLMGCMNKSHFASYKFKPSDVIEGLNRYFSEAKANRYRRVPLEIHNGEVKPGNYYVLRDIVFYVAVPKVKECGYYYLVCDPEEVVGVAINWLREEHDIFYTPGMEAPVEDFDVDEAAREYEKKTRTSEPVVPVAKVREILGINREVDFFEALKCARGDMDATTRLRLESSELRHQNHELVRRLADIRKAAGMADDDSRDLVEYVETLRKVEEEYEQLYKQYKKMYCELRYAKFTNLSEERDRYKGLYENLKGDILKVYREIFDCSFGDPEGTDKETLQDILTEYKRVLELKDAAEEKTIKYKELARENEEKANKYKVRLDNAERQLRWTEEVISKRLEMCEVLTREREKTRRMEQKLSEIKDICDGNSDVMNIIGE